MGFLFILGLFFFATCVVLPWVNHMRINSLQDEINALQRRLEVREPSSVTVSPFWTAKSDTPAAIPDVQALAVTTYAPPSPEAEYTFDEILKDGAREQDQSSRGFELQLGTKLPVWIGALSLICAAFFLVKYSIDAGWMGPATRVAIGSLFGTGLLAGGQWTGRRPAVANHVRIGQGLVGAGLVALYMSIYAATHLYGLLGPLTGFCGLSAVTATAVIMSLRHGQPIAVFGLVGGLLTPLLIASPHPDAVSLFAYLFVLFAFMLFILARQGWWLLACLALAGVLLWDGAWLATGFSGDDDVVMALFALGLCAAALFATRLTTVQTVSTDAARQGLNLLAIGGGAATLVALNFRIPLSLFDWSVLEALTLGCFALAWFESATYKRLPFAKLVLDLALFAWWTRTATPLNDFVMLGVLGSIYVVLPALLMRRITTPAVWAIVQLTAGLSLYIVAYESLVLPAPIWGVAGLALAGLAVYQAREMRVTYRADDGMQDYLIALYAFGATSFLSLVLAITVPSDYFALAFAGQVAMTLWIRTRVAVPFLSIIAGLLTMLLIAVKLQDFLPFLTLAAESLVRGTPSAAAMQGALITMPVIRYGLPALLLGFGLAFQRRHDADDRLSHLLFGTALALGLAMGYCLVRRVLNSDPAFLTIKAGFFERGAITLMIAALSVAILAAVRPLRADFMKPWGRALFYLALARIVYFDLVLFNPFYDAHQFVGAWPLLNGITLVYGAGLALAVWATGWPGWASRPDSMQTFYCGLAGLLLFALSTLSVRQYFHGGWPAIGPITPPELYGYSIAWLAVGLTLLGLGIARQSKSLRLASLAFIILAIGKVFIFDAAQLEGLYRVFSFLGLGISLIGLSFFYTRFVFRENAEVE